jgi:octaprenyl-diphosphate synthase
MLTQVETLMRESIAGLDEHALSLFDKLPAGKRLRAKLILKIAGESETSVKLASIIELIHAASLLHDDVIDDANTRRGIASLNALYGNKTAIMLGDILYSKGFSELTSFSESIAKTVADAVTMLSVGELMDVELSKALQVDEARYFDMIYKKTAVLIEASASAAAQLAGKDVAAFALYGKNLGLAFQIIDDVLDITMDSETLGKPALHDYEEGKTTLPYIYLLESLEGEERDKLVSLYKKHLNKDEAGWIKSIMISSGAIAKSVTLAQKLGHEALDAIQDAQSPDLEAVIKNMIEREF